MLNITLIEETVVAVLRDKFRKYKPETTSMPFHTRLLGRDRMALYSFIHSLSTNFGTAIFEKIAVAIAMNTFDSAAAQQKVGRSMTTESQAAITTIMNRLSSGEIDPNHAQEMAILQETARLGRTVTKKLRAVDLLLCRGNARILIDLKTAKPNMSDFEGYKQMMLEWAAATLHEHPDADVRTIIAIPYNPYEPEPYVRWTIKGMLEIQNQSQLMVGAEFWDFLAGDRYTMSSWLALSVSASACGQRLTTTSRGSHDETEAATPRHHQLRARHTQQGRREGTGDSLGGLQEASPSGQASQQA